MSAEKPPGASAAPVLTTGPRFTAGPQGAVVFFRVVTRRRTDCLIGKSFHHSLVRQGKTRRIHPQCRLDRLRLPDIHVRRMVRHRRVISKPHLLPLLVLDLKGIEKSGPVHEEASDHLLILRETLLNNPPDPSLLFDARHHPQDPVPIDSIGLHAARPWPFMPVFPALSKLISRL